MPDKVIVTGGLYTPNQVNFENVQCNDNENEYSGQVVVYNEQGWVEDWPSILTSRYDHGCGHYVNADSEVVSRYSEFLHSVLHNAQCIVEYILD